MPDLHGDAAGRRVLVVEDEFLLADDLRGALEDVGAEVVGPVVTVDAALTVLGSDKAVDGAIPDVTLGEEKSFPVAEALRKRNLPFLFLTGFDDPGLPPSIRGAPVLHKPANPRLVLRSLFA